MQQPGVKPLIIHSGIGDINLSDIQLAAASTAVVYGFHVNVPPQIKKSAENQGLTVTTFKIIYDMLNQIELILRGLVKMETVLAERGRVKVLKLFRASKEAQIVGGEITQGSAYAHAHVVINRASEPVGTGRVISLHKGPESVKELPSGEECGLSIQSATKIFEGDVLVLSQEEKVVVTDNANDEDGAE